MTLLTVVLSINQLVLARKLGAPGELRDRIDGALRYRADVEAATGGGVAPATPRQFLEHLHEDLRARADALVAAGDHGTGALDRRTEALAGSLRRDVDRVERALEAGGEQVFAVVSATLDTNHADQLHEVARIQDEYADALSEEDADALEGVTAVLLQIDVARTYFQTVYVQEELAYLSRVLLYVGVPAVTSSGLALVVYNTALVTAVPEGLFLGVVVAAFGLGFAPLAVLFAFVLRLAWVAQRTATVAPFSPESTYRS